MKTRTVEQEVQAGLADLRKLVLKIKANARGFERMLKALPEYKRIKAIEHRENRKVGGYRHETSLAWELASEIVDALDAIDAASEALGKHAGMTEARVQEIAKWKREKHEALDAAAELHEIGGPEYRKAYDAFHKANPFPGRAK